jgi:hypothetical protein
MVLWQVVEHCGPSTGTAIIHVAAPPAELAVDDTTYSVASLWATPVACELKPGRHRLRMLREGRVCYDEEFSLAPGEEKVLAAWDGGIGGRTPDVADRTQGGAGSRTRRPSHEADPWRRWEAGRR